MAPIAAPTSVRSTMPSAVAEPAPALETVAPTIADAPDAATPDSLRSLDPPGGLHPIADQPQAARFNFFTQAAADAKQAQKEFVAKLMDMARK